MLKFRRTENFLGFVMNGTICGILDWFYQAEISLLEDLGYHIKNQISAKY